MIKMHYERLCNIREGYILADDIRDINGSVVLTGGKLLFDKDIEFLKDCLINVNRVPVLDYLEVKELVMNSNELMSSYVLNFNRNIGKFLEVQLTDAKGLVDFSTILSDVVLGNETIFSVMLLLMFSHSYTYNHSLNVALLSTQIAISLGLSDENIFDLVSASLLHDLGKVIISKDIIDKPGKLSNDEFSVIKKHTIAGYKIAKDNCTLSSSAYYAVLQHHEKLDGSGYPFNTKGESIGILSRILAVADIFDALTSTRPYRKSMSAFKAFKIIDEDVKAGKLDGVVVNNLKKRVLVYPKGCFVKMIDESYLYVLKDDSKYKPIAYNVLERKMFILNQKQVACVY